MNTFLRIRARVFFSLLAVVFFGTLLVGCGGGGSPTDSGGNSSGLVLPEEGDAWVSDEYNAGIVFQSDGKVRLLQNHSGSWEVYAEGTYVVTGDTISVNIPNDPEESFKSQYSVYGSSLTRKLDDVTIVFTKKTIGGSTGPDPNVPGGGGTGSLVLPKGQAWAYMIDNTHGEGLIFLDDGRVFDLDYGWDASGWRIEGSGTYNVHGSGIEIYWEIPEGMMESGTFTVTGDKLKLTLNNVTEEYTKRSGVNVSY
jgi:hypothetical protein